MMGVLIFEYNGGVFMTTEKLHEQDASISRQGDTGSVYCLLPIEYRKVAFDDNTNELKIVLANGKHGKFIYVYDPKQAKKKK